MKAEPTFKSQHAPNKHNENRSEHLVGSDIKPQNNTDFSVSADQAPLRQYDHSEIANGNSPKTPKFLGIGILPLYSILKYLAIFGAVFFTAVIQSGFFLNFRPLGAAPDLCLALVVAVALKWGAKKGAVVGIIAGVCIDAFSELGISFLIPFYFVLGILLGLFSEDKNTKGFPFFAVAMSVCALCRVLLTFFELCLTAPSFSAGGVLLHTILPNFFITLIFSPILYLSVLAVDRIFGKKDRTTRR